MTRSISFCRPMTGSSLPWRHQFGEVPAKAIESRCFRFTLAGGPFPAAAATAAFACLIWHVVSQKVQDFLADVFQFQAEVHEDLSGHAFLLAEQAQEEVFRADVVMIEIACFFDGIFDDLLRPRRLRQLAHGNHVGPRLDDLFDFQANFAQIGVQVLEDIGSDARALP